MKKVVAAVIVLFAVAAEARANNPAAKDHAAPQSLGLSPFRQPADFFPILPWDALHDWKAPHRNLKHGLESIADCGFTIGGFVKPEDLPLCEKLGLAAIMAPAETEQPWFGEWQKMSDQEIDKRVKEMVEKTAHSKAVLGYFIMDEPGAPAFPALAKAVAAVKKYAPGKLAYINLFPSYATVGAPDTSQLGTASYTEYLERFVNEVRPQLLSYDNYMVQGSDDLQGEKAAIYYNDLLEVRRVSRKYGLPFWNIVSCNQILKEYTAPSPASLAFQAYTTLAAGGQGLTWYKYYSDGYAYAPIDGHGNKSETWQYLQVVNRQVRTLGPIMGGLKSTGVFFTSPPMEKSLPLLPGRIVKQVRSQASLQGATGAQPPIMVGEFADGRGKDYVMLVNLSLERSANIKLETLTPYKTKQVFSAIDGRLLPLDEKNGHWLPAGHGLLVKLEGSANSAQTRHSLQDSIDAVPDGNTKPCRILLNPGKYEGHVIVPKNKTNLESVGESTEKTIITSALNQYAASKPGGQPLFNNASFVVLADDFRAENITFENSLGDRGQALAMRVDGDRAVFKHCRLLGWQDTLLLKRGRQYFQDCYIEGRVDFIYGGATTIFDHCEIHSKNGGYVTAANTPQNQPYGFVFLNCKLTGDPRPWSGSQDVRTLSKAKSKPPLAYLGRPWRPYASVAYLNCELGGHIKPEGWDNWRNPANEQTARFGEYHSTGPGAKPDAQSNGQSS